MEVRLKPIPAFYCCYLLRSTIRHSNLYVGSSPHPARRLAQHNGKVKGGAVRTSRLSLRPWEMVCIVAGFPSNIAALQFEWAWHNSHLTRHILPEDRLTQPTAHNKVNAKTGKTRRRPGRPRTSLIDKLSNLHLLLRAPYFSKWPLELRFFNTAVHKTWLAWDDRVNQQIRPETRILLDLSQENTPVEEPSSAQPPAKKRKIDLIGKGGVDGVDPTYARFQSMVQKLKELEDDSSTVLKCQICKKPINLTQNLFTICLHDSCQSLSHVSCLSERFLRESHTGAMLPREGKCPLCKGTQEWSELMRVLSLRIRGEKEVKKLLKKRSQGIATIAAEMLSEEDSTSEENESALEDSEVDIDEDEDSELNDTASVASVASVSSQPKRVKSAAPVPSSQRLEIVIEDSEDDR